jgi:hypothetical protein
VLVFNAWHWYALKFFKENSVLFMLFITKLTSILFGSLPPQKKLFFHIYHRRETR